MTKSHEGWDLVVTAGPGHVMTRLNECLAAWPREAVPGKRILVCSGTGAGQNVLASMMWPGWEVLGHYAEDAFPLSVGLARCERDWVVHWDADEEPGPDAALRFGRAVALARAREAVVGLEARPDYGVNLGSVWRRTGAAAAGGWPLGVLENWRRGWAEEDVEEIDKGAGVMKKQLFQIVLPLLVEQIIKALSEDKIKEVADYLINKLEAVVRASPTLIDDQTVLPVAKHIRTLLD
jgi:hypothetical protein